VDERRRRRRRKRRRRSRSSCWFRNKHLLISVSADERQIFDSNSS
jgi:hypothetical protein